MGECSKCRYLKKCIEEENVLVCNCPDGEPYYSRLEGRQCKTGIENTIEYLREMSGCDFEVPMSDEEFLSVWDKTHIDFKRAYLFMFDTYEEIVEVFRRMGIVL